MKEDKKWRIYEPQLGGGIGAALTVGLIELAPDRVGRVDIEEYLSVVDDLLIINTRVDIAPKVTPDTLFKMRDHLTGAASLLARGSRLDVIGFPCTTGTVRIGVDDVHAQIAKGREGVPVTTSIEASHKALERFNVGRMSLLAPYLPDTGNLISSYFEERGFIIDEKATFSLDGDVDINRVTEADLIHYARECVATSSDALFISCNALRTSRVVADIERAIGKPVITSNQALAWDCLRLSGSLQKIEGRGRLFIEH